MSLYDGSDGADEQNRTKDEIQDVQSGDSIINRHKHHDKQFREQEVDARLQQVRHEVVSVVDSDEEVVRAEAEVEDIMEGSVVPSSSLADEHGTRLRGDGLTLSCWDEIHSTPWHEFQHQ